MLTHLSACDHTCMSVRVRLCDLQVNVHNRTYLIKIKNFSLKDSFQNDKPHLGENFAKYVYEKEFISRIHKDPLQLNNNNTLINSAKNGQRSPCETIGQGPGPNVRLSSSSNKHTFSAHGGDTPASAWCQALASPGDRGSRMSPAGCALSSGSGKRSLTE